MLQDSPHLTVFTEGSLKFGWDDNSDPVTYLNFSKASGLLPQSVLLSKLYRADQQIPRRLQTDSLLGIGCNSRLGIPTKRVGSWTCTAQHKVFAAARRVIKVGGR